MPRPDLPSFDDLYHEAIQTALRIDAPAETVNTLMKIAASMHAVGNRDYAAALLPKILILIRELEDLREQAYLLRLFIKFQCDMGFWEDAIRTLPLLEFDSDQSGMARREIAVVQARLGLIRDALETSEAIEDLDDYEIVLETIGERQARLRLFAEAIDTAAKIEAGELRAQLLRSIAAEQWAAGRHAESLQTLRTAQTMARGIVVETVRDKVLLETVRGFNEIHRITDALSTAKEIVGPVKRIEAFCSIVVTLRQDGNATGGRAAANEASTAARKIADPYYRATALKQIGEALHRIGETEEAKDIFREALSAIKTIRNTYSQAKMMTDFGIDLTGLDMADVAKRVFRLAVALAQTIEGESFQLSCLHDIVEAQAASELIGEANNTLEIIEEIRDESSRNDLEDGTFDWYWTTALGAVAAALARDDSPDRRKQGKDKFIEALDRTGKIADPLNRSMALQTLAEKIAALPTI